MNNLHLSEEAQNDLLEIKAYIEEELLNPSAVAATVSRCPSQLYADFVWRQYDR